MKLLRRALFAAAGTIAYAHFESRHFRLQTHRLACVRPVPDVSVLHISDTHLTSSDRARADFVAGIAKALPMVDLIFFTGDMLEDDSGIDLLLHAVEPLRARYGCYYVLGSHDYYQARFKLPTKYLLKRYRGQVESPPADTARLEAGLAARGWVALTNRTETIDTEVGRIRLTGVDDPYIHRERTDHIARSRDDDLAIGLSHSPDVVSEWALQGYDLILCGHTHAGQLRAPYLGALVTNSTVPRDLAGGPHLVGSTWLHVSPGIGTSRFTRIRFLARPEATLLELSGPGT